MAENPQFRIVFMGTPAFAADILEALLGEPDFDVRMVYTMPDRPAGRGAKLRMPEVKELALSHGLPVRQPENFRNPDEIAFLDSLQPDFLIVAAYGMILPEAVLATAGIAPVNVHASILPAFRGAAPIQRAIMSATDGNARTGVSIMRMARGMDTGPVYASESLIIGRHDAGSLTRELAGIGARLLVRSLPLIASGDLPPLPQDESQATYAQKIEKSEAILNFDKSVTKLDAMVRALTPAPGARCIFKTGISGDGQPFQMTILSGKPADCSCRTDAGTLCRDGERLLIACLDGFYEIEWLKPAGRKAMGVADFLRGHKFPQGPFGRAVY